MKFDSHVQPICLPEYYSKSDDADWICTVTGWGAQKRTCPNLKFNIHVICAMKFLLTLKLYNI